jgi:WD40 repeat protein
VTCGEDGTARVWDVASGPELLTLSVTLSPGSTGPLDAGAEWSPSGDRIVTSSWDRTVEVWDAVTGALLLTLHPSQEVGDAAWSPSGAQIATGGLGALVTVFDAATGDRILSIFPLHTDRVHDVSWSPAGDRIATSGWYGTAEVFDATTGEVLLPLVDRKADLIAFLVHAWSPRGDRIVTIDTIDRHSNSTTVRNAATVWDAATGAELLTLSGFDGRVTFVLWSADETRIITYSEDNVGRVWDASALSPTYGEELLTFTGHTGSVKGMDVSPAGDRFVTGSYDGTVRIWDINTGAELARYSLGGMVYSVDWSPDGTRIVVSVSDGTAKVLPAWQTTQELIDHAKECCAVRELTAEEREQFGLGSR